MRVNFWKISQEIDFAKSDRSELENTSFHFHSTFSSVKDISQN